MKRDGTVLLVDDEPGIRGVVSRTLAAAGIDVVAVRDGASAREALTSDHVALVLLDVNLPDVNGLDLCEEIRREYAVPVVMLTVVADERDVVRALESGAEDYIRKPFATGELLARVKAVMRRTRGQAAALRPQIAAGPLTLDSKSYRANLRGEPLPLTPTEYRLLAFLVQNLGRVVTHDQLLTFVWGPGYEGEHHMLHVTMSRLRRKLAKLSGGRIIRTLPGVGYEFVAQEG